MVLSNGTVPGRRNGIRKLNVVFNLFSSVSFMFEIFLNVAGNKIT